MPLCAAAQPQSCCSRSPPTPPATLPCPVPSAGKPLFGTLIALLHRATPVLGIIDQPILKVGFIRRAW